MAAGIVRLVRADAHRRVRRHDPIALPLQLRKVHLVGRVCLEYDPLHIRRKVGFASTGEAAGQLNNFRERFPLRLLLRAPNLLYELEQQGDDQHRGISIDSARHHFRSYQPTNGKETRSTGRTGWTYLSFRRTGLSSLAVNAPLLQHLEKLLATDEGGVRGVRLLDDAHRLWERVQRLLALNLIPPEIDRAPLELACY